MTSVIDIAKKAKFASINSLKLSTRIKNAALLKIAENLEKYKDYVLAANKTDLTYVKPLVQSGKMSVSVYNRLKLDENKISTMIQGIKDIVNLEDPVNKIYWEKEIAADISLTRVTCPIGVIGVIFEARPDVITQISALAIKSSNAVILKGGSEAINTNKAVFKIIEKSLSQIEGYPENTVNLIFSRSEVKEMLEADKYINLIIPRGSEALVKYIKANTRIPVLGHADGVCHIYIDESADLQKVIDVVIDAKCQYPSACNSVETVLINRNCEDEILPELLDALKENSVEINSDRELKEKYSEFISGIVEDWHKEYGDKIISLKLVDNVKDAVNHINEYGSGHTDCIITENDEAADYFMTFTDSSGVYHNISTRFADGYRYGFGAEVGISCNKTHARGPVGLDGLIIYKYKLVGDGDTVKEFIDGEREFYK